MLGDSYRLFGTTNVYEITREKGAYWIITIKSPEGDAIEVRMKKTDFTDGVIMGKISKIETDASEHTWQA